MAIEDDLNESEQVERLFAWWRDNWIWLLSGIAIGVAIIAGWFYFTGRQTLSAEQAGQLYRQMIAASDRNDFGQMEALHEQLGADHDTTPYADQGSLLIARLYVETGEYEKAAVLLREVMQDAGDTELRLIARLRLARVLLQTDQADEALALLQPDAAGAFTGLEQQVRGDAFFAKGNMEEARAAYAAALASVPELGSEDRQLVELKLQDLAAEAAAPAPVEQAAP